MDAARKPTAEEKKRKKQARKEINAIFKWVKAGCQRLKKFEETMKQVEKIKPVLERYQDVLNPNIVKDITNILDRIDRATGNADQFCELSERLEDLSATLYNPAIPRWVQNLTPAGWAGVVGGVVTAVVIVGGLITAFSPLFQATIDINNRGCEAILPPQGIPNIPGVTLWSQPIRDGEQGQAKIPPFVKIGIDATQSDTIAISVFDIHLLSLQPSGLRSLSINGREIRNQVFTENLGVRTQYDLVISCQ